jgi:hypothetical protein
MQWYQIILEYLKVLLSWPVIVLVIALIFRNELSKLPGRLEQVVWGKDSRIIFGRENARKITKQLDKAAHKPAMSKRQQEQLQKDIDSVFELGVATGLSSKGQQFNSMANVQLIKDDTGNVTGLQYIEP